MAIWIRGCVLTALFVSAGCSAGDSGDPGEPGADDEGTPATAGDADGGTTADDPASEGDDDAGEDAGDADDGDDGPMLPDGADDIDAYIIGLGTPETPATEVVEGEPTASERSGDYTCSSTDMLETKRFDEIVAFAANSGTLFPGAMIGGDSMADGTLTPKVFSRAPLTFSASLEGVLDGPVSAELEEPTLSSFRDAMSELLDATVVGQTPASIAFEIQEVHSAEQLSLALGLDVSWMTGDVSASMDFDKQSTNSRFLVDFTQAYYTVDVDPPARPSEFLGSDVTLEDVQGTLRDEPPAYVSSVTYGRIVYFAVTSEFSSEELRAALDFGFTAGAVDVDGSVSLTHSEVLSDSTITAFILGGDGNVAVQTIQGAEGITDFLLSGGVYSKESPGAPIGYKLAYLADNSPARFSLTTDYEVQECVRVTQDVRVTLSNLHVVDDGSDANGNLEIYGWIRGWDAESNAYPLMEREADEAVKIDRGQSWPQTGAIASQIIPVVPQPDNHFVVSINLREKDNGLNADDNLGDHEIEFRFEDGWRNDDFRFPVANGNQQVEVSLSFSPVP